SLLRNRGNGASAWKSSSKVGVPGIRPGARSARGGVEQDQFNSSPAARATLNRSPTENAADGMNQVALVPGLGQEGVALRLDLAAQGRRHPLTRQESPGPSS